MKKITLLILLMCHFFVSAQQHNMSLLANLHIETMHNTELNDIWGYTDEFGNEYALVGTHDGVSIVDISIPTNPVEVFWVPGMNSIWRDIKTYGDYAYVTTEASEGMLIINLTALPNATGITYSHYLEPAPFNWTSAHNLFIDDNGFLYVFGSNYSQGGAIIYDLNVNSINLAKVGEIDNWYVHDGYAQNDTAYLANVYEGFFSIFDVSDKANPVLLGTALTPSIFTHNIWGDNSGHVYTTDEVSNGYIAAYDVSNPTTPFLIDKTQSSPGDNVIPHNTHVKGNYIYTSYYADGIVVHDITHPNNLVEVGRFDTWPGTSSDFVGCWGVYPFFNSGVIVASDMENGLFIIDDNVHQGSYVQGTITDLVTGAFLSNVQVTINGTSIQDFSNAFGDYATGIDSNGTVDITYSKTNYYPKTLTVPVTNGSVTIQDIQLEQVPHADVLVKVFDAQTNQPIVGADISFDFTVDTRAVTNAIGESIVQIYYPGQYIINVGKWGYKTKCFSDTLIDYSTTLIEIYLEKGYQDDFIFDYGWTNVYTGTKNGNWVRDIPLGVLDGGNNIQNPFNDADYDCNNYCYITGNSSNNSNVDEVNDGEAILFSPVMDLTSYQTPYVNYAVWYFDKYGAVPDDTLFIYMNNGTDQVLIDFFDPETTPLSQWISSSVSLNDKITVTSTMQLQVFISDYVTTENVTEAGFDLFSVTNSSILGVEKQNNVKQNFNVYPNPTNQVLNITTSLTNYKVELFSLDGKLIYQAKNISNINLSSLEKGIYIIKQTNLKSNETEVKKVVVN
jgi:choice-of-anchor B domain-containing protein